MNTRMRLALAFVVGVLLGGAAMGFATKRNFDGFLRTVIATNVLEESLTLQELERGGPERYKRRILGYSFPVLAESLARYRGDPGVDAALWAIRRAYEREGLALPARVAPHVRDLPPQAEATCRTRQQEIEAKATAPPP